MIGVESLGSDSMSHNRDDTWKATEESDVPWPALSWQRDTSVQVSVILWGEAIASKRRSGCGLIQMMARTRAHAI